MSRRILVIDDHADTLEALRELLRSWGHEVQIAVTGSEGITLALERQPDVALVDIGLPDLDGYEVARRIRAAAESVSLVALTGSDEDEKAGADVFDDYLLKPAEPEALRAVVERA